MTQRTLQPHAKGQRRRDKGDPAEDGCGEPTEIPSSLPRPGVMAHPSATQLTIHPRQQANATSRAKPQGKEGLHLPKVGDDQPRSEYLLCDHGQVLHR